MKNKIFIIISLLFLSIISSGCNNDMKAYYHDESNYVIATGTISHISNNEEIGAIYFEFMDLTPVFDDTCFKIVGDNYRYVIDEGIMASVQIGQEVEFCTSPKYFGDGYVMPIVSFSVGEDVLLEYEVGMSNFLSWLDKER